MIYIKNIRAILPAGIFDRVIATDGTRIADITEGYEPRTGDTVIDGGGLYLSPGFIDIHVHGGGGCSAMSDSPDDIAAMCKAHAQYGTTSLLPTTLAMPIPAIVRAIKAIRAATALDTDATILGAHAEGPCLSPAQSGAQSPDDLIIPAEAKLDSIFDAWPSGIRIMGAAPELDGALELGDELTRRGIVASIAHSDATYAQVEEAMSHGYSDVTHLYSCCSGMKRVHGYRVPGVIEAGLNLDGLTTQVIADGRHLPLELLRLIYRCKGADKIILITDGLEYSASELSEGTVYRQLNGVETVYEDGVMKLMDREAFAGSAATMNRLVYNMLQAGVSLTDAVRMATLNPARRLGAVNKGSIAVGADADLVLFDGDVDVRLVMCMGRIVKADELVKLKSVD